MLNVASPSTTHMKAVSASLLPNASAALSGNPKCASCNA